MVNTTVQWSQLNAVAQCLNGRLVGFLEVAIIVSIELVIYSWEKYLDTQSLW